MPLIELTAVFRRERHRWDQTVILDCDVPKQNGDGQVSYEPVTVKATVADGELVNALSYRFYGQWKPYTNQRTKQTEQQFHAQTFVRSQPHGQAGVIRYLMQAPGVGHATANTLWKKFAGDAVRILREQPEVAAAAVPRFSESTAAEAAEYLKREAGLEACTIDLIDLLGGRHFPRDTHKWATAKWGNRAAELIRRNPFLLRGRRGCGFLIVDRMYLELGGDPARIKRQALCAWYAVNRDTNGHTWYDRQFVEEGLREKIGGAAVNVAKSVRLALRSRLLAGRRDADGHYWFAERGKADSERIVAEHVKAMLADDSFQWPSPNGLDISEHQCQQLRKALRGYIAIFGGSPGTGKTYSAARVIASLIGQFGAGDVAVAAPTGKAAVRITEAMLEYGIGIRATTIHRLLGVTSADDGDGWGFEHDEGNPLPCRYVVIDEGSMIDAGLMASLLRACGRGTHLLIVADTNQLPPVGHGAPVRDMIAAGVPYGELREIFRNSGAIVRACAAIRDGQPWEPDGTLDAAAGKNLGLIPAHNGAVAADRIVSALKGIGRDTTLDPVWDCQVIVAVNKKSPLSRVILNQRLQAELNPHGKQARGSPFRAGDKIVCLKNGFLPLVDGNDGTAEATEDGKVFVANGELGRVQDVFEKLTVAEFSGPKRVVKIPRGTDGDGDSDTGCQFDLGYAVTCHKMQGSECPVVLVALDEYPGARMVCGREWLYTAISRAKKACLLVGKVSTAKSMCLRVALEKRKTLLTELLSQ